MISLKILIAKYSAQLKSLSSSFDNVHQLNTDSPIKFQDSNNVKLSFVTIADTHLPKNENSAANFANLFKDIENSNEKFDAFLMAGDIAEFGKKSEYKLFFDVLDKQTVISNVLLTMGNHDARFFYNKNKKLIMNKVNEYLNIDTKNKAFYSYDINGYTFIVLCTDKRVLEKAYISNEQLDFLDQELQRANKDSKPVFVMCHQPFAFTHGLPEVWKNGDLGEQNDIVRSIMEKYKNVVFINGHLHGGIFDRTFEVINKENGVYSLSVPGYRKENNFGIKDCGVGYYCEVYDDRIVFTARDFEKGKPINQMHKYVKFELPIK